MTRPTVTPNSRRCRCELKLRPPGDAAGHSCIAIVGSAVAGPVERAITLETGSADRVTNMEAFAAPALDLLPQALIG